MAKLALNNSFILSSSADFCVVSLDEDVPNCCLHLEQRFIASTFFASIASLSSMEDGNEAKHGSDAVEIVCVVFV